LELGWQAGGVVEPVLAWGSRGRTLGHGGTWHLYRYDYNWARLWRDPGRLVATGCRGVVEANYSTFPAMSRAEVLWGVYRKRTMACVWGRAGVKLWVDLNVDPEFLEEFALLGVPYGWRSYALRPHRDLGVGHLERCVSLACGRAGTDEVRVLVVGGGARSRDWSRSRGYNWCVEHSDRVRGRADGRTGRGKPLGG
jgi:hypothetical protein